MMRKLLFLLTLVFLTSATLKAQNNPTPILAPTASWPTPFAGVPTGPCLSQQTAVNTTNGNFYSCNSGVWALVNGGGSGSGLPNGCASSNSGNLNCTQSFNVGSSSALAVIANAVGLAFTEGPNTCTPTNAQSCIRVDSNDHHIHCSISGGPDTNCLPLLPATAFSGHFVYFPNNNSQTIGDSGFSAVSFAQGSSFTANLPVIGGGGNAVTVGSRTGNTTQFATWNGSTTSARCVDTDVNGNLQITASDCSAGGATNQVAKGISTNSSGTATVVDDSIAPPTTPNSVPFILTSTPTAGTSAKGAFSWPGITVTSQVGTSYTPLAADRSTCIEHSNVNPVTYTIPDAGGTNFANGYNFCLLNLGAGTITVNNTSSSKFNILGSALFASLQTTFTLAQGQVAYFYLSPNNNWDVVKHQNATVPAFTNLSSTCAGAQAWALANQSFGNALITLTGSCTLNVTSPSSGGIYSLEVNQGVGGSHTLALGTGCAWAVSGGGAGAVTPTTTAGAIDVLSFNFDGVYCLANYTKNFSMPTVSQIGSANLNNQPDGTATASIAVNAGDKIVCYVAASAVSQTLGCSSSASDTFTAGSKGEFINGPGTASSEYFIATANATGNPTFSCTASIATNCTIIVITYRGAAGVEDTSVAQASGQTNAAWTSSSFTTSRGTEILELCVTSESASRTVGNIAGVTAAFATNSNIAGAFRPSCEFLIVTAIQSAVTAAMNNSASANSNGQLIGIE